MTFFRSNQSESAKPKEGDFKFTFDELAAVIPKKGSIKPSSTAPFKLMKNQESFMQLETGHESSSGIKLHLNIDIPSDYTLEQKSELIKTVWDAIIPFVLEEPELVNQLKVLHPHWSAKAQENNLNEMKRFQQQLKVREETPGLTDDQKADLQLCNLHADEWIKDRKLEEERRFVSAITIYLSNRKNNETYLAALDRFMDRCEKKLDELKLDKIKVKPPAKFPFDFPIKSRKYFSIRGDKVNSEAPYLGIFDFTKLKYILHFMAHPFVQHFVNVNDPAVIPKFVHEPVYRKGAEQMGNKSIQDLAEKVLQMTNKIVFIMQKDQDIIKNENCRKLLSEFQAIIKNGFMSCRVRLNCIARICEIIVEERARSQLLPSKPNKADDRGDFKAFDTRSPPLSASAAASIPDNIFEKFVTIFSDMRWNDFSAFEQEINALHVKCLAAPANRIHRAR